MELVAGLAHGQVYTPPAPAQPAEKPTPTDTAAPAAKEKPAAGPLGNEIPVLDPAAPYDYFLLVGNDNDFLGTSVTMLGGAPVDAHDGMILAHGSPPAMR